MIGRRLVNTVALMIIQNLVPFSPLIGCKNLNSLCIFSFIIKRELFFLSLGFLMSKVEELYNYRIFVEIYTLKVCP